MSKSLNNKKELIFEWHKVKISLDAEPLKNFYFKPKEVWWASIGVNIGHEEDGKNKKFGRPVVILKKFNKHLVLVVPLTSKIKLDKHYYYKFVFSRLEFISAIISQIRLLSSKRLFRKMGIIDSRDFLEIQRRVSRFF